MNGKECGRTQKTTRELEPNAKITQLQALFKMLTLAFSEVLGLSHCIRISHTHGLAKIAKQHEEARRIPRRT